MNGWPCFVYTYLKVLADKLSQHDHHPWWRHQPFSALLALCAGNSPVSGEFPSQRPVTRSFDGFFICAWINGWVKNREAGDLRRHRPHYDVTVMYNQCDRGCESINSSFVMNRNVSLIGSSLAPRLWHINQERLAMPTEENSSTKLNVNVMKSISI